MATLYDQTALFQIRQDGTGTNLGASVKLSLDDDNGPCPAELLSATDGTFQKVVVRGFFFPSTDNGSVGDYADARVAILARLNAMATACKWKPPVVKTLPRGGVIMPNIYQNFGDLQLSYRLTGGLGEPSYETALANCCLMEFGVEEDIGLAALVVRLTFGKVLDQLAVTIP